MIPPAEALRGILHMKRSEYLKSAAVLSFGGLAAKAVGVFYKIPLSNLLGSFGMGLYQMAYPLFVVLLTFSSAGIPSALSRIIARETAEGREYGGTVRAALSLFALFGLTGSILMCLVAPLLGRLQGEEGLALCYLSLAPSVFLVALIAVFRGYFQGKNNMFPTAASEIAEQLVKAAAGLYAAGRYAFDPVRAVAGALGAVTLSEAVALLLLLLEYKRIRRPPCLAVPDRRRGALLPAVLPVMAATSLLPLSQMLDSVLLVRLLAQTSDRAVSLYGLFSGGALTLVHLPATLSYGLAAASVPAVSAGEAKGEEGRNRAMHALFFTLALSLPCALGLFLFAGPLSRLLFPALSEGDLSLLTSLLRVMAVSAATVPCVDTLAACLTGMGRAKKAALSMAAAVAIKLVAEVIFVGRFSVFGAAIALNGCYTVAFFLDLFYTVRKTKEKAYDHGRKSRSGAGRAHGERQRGAACGGRGARSDRVDARSQNA